MNVFKKNRSNQYVAFFWISFAMVLFLNLLVWLYLDRVENEFRLELRERLVDINQVLSRLIVETNDNMDISLIVPGDRQSIPYLYYSQLLETIRQNSKLQSILLVSPQGEILASSPQQIGNQKISSLAESADFEKAARGVFVVSKISRFAGEQFISAFAPIRNLEGFISAVLIIEAKANFFTVLGSLKNRLLLFSFINFVIIAIIAFFLFKTIRKSIRYQAEIKNKQHLVQLGTMAATVAHELRNPLGIIEASNEVIQKKYGQTEDEVFSYIPQEVRRLNTLIDDFLKFARAPQLKIGLFSVEKAVHKLQMSSAPANWERVEISFPVQQPPFYTDPNLVEQILLNLFSNALQASDKNGKVHIRFSFKKKNLFIEVRDEGSGISDENLKKVFEPFFSTKEKGTGLGLAITKRITEHLQGKITIRSGRVTGSVVRVRLPDMKEH